MNFTAEQADIIQCIADPVLTQHIAVNAKAGSGKSTVAVACAEHCWKRGRRTTLYLTFSTQLKLKERASAKEGKRGYLRVESFHSCVVNVFGYPCSDQHTLEAFLDHPAATPADSLASVGLLVVDEAQDLTASYVCLVQRLLPFLHPGHRILMLGDRFQNVFQCLQDSSPQYLDNPCAYFGGTFLHKHMSTSFRLTGQMADWVNRNVSPLALEHHYPGIWAEHGDSIVQAWGPGVHAHPSRGAGLPVDYVRFDFYKQPLPASITETVRSYITRHGIDSVLILTDSAYPGARHAVTRLLNETGGNAAHNWIVLNNDLQEDEAVMKLKGVVATPYKMKGREQRLVVFFGFDRRLERWTDRPRPLLAFALAYVACTRAYEKLVVAGHLDTGREFFTITRQQQPPDRRVCRVTSTHTLSRFIPFDRRLDCMHIVQRAVCTGGVQSHGPATVTGRTPATTEPVDRWYALVVRDVIPLVLDGSVTLAEVDWPGRVDAVIATHVADTGLAFSSRQLARASVWVDCTRLDSIVTACVDMVYDYFTPFMLAYEAHHVLASQSIRGEAFLLFGRCMLVHFCFSPSTAVADAQEAVLLAALLHCERDALRTFILNARVGELVEVYLPPACRDVHTYMASVLQRKHLSHLAVPGAQA
jgi:hypothetical protein